MDHAPPPDRTPVDPGVPRVSRHQAFPRAVRVGLAISAAVHLVLLGLYPGLASREVSGPGIVMPSVARPTLQGMTVIEVVTVTSEDDPERPPEPEEVEDVETPTVRPGAPDLRGLPETGLVAPGPTAAERLRPRLGDERLWARVDPALAELTTEQRLELELSGRIVEWRDSVNAALEAERAATDWTYTDSEGGRWGVADGKVYLGDVAIPVPFGFGVTPDRRDEVNRRAWEWEEIQRGAATGAIRDSWKERAQAIRERRDRERAAKVPPDTTGIRR